MNACVGVFSRTSAQRVLRRDVARSCRTRLAIDDSLNVIEKVVVASIIFCCRMFKNALVCYHRNNCRYLFIAISCRVEVFHSSRVSHSILRSTGRPIRTVSQKTHHESFGAFAFPTDPTNRTAALGSSIWKKPYSSLVGLGRRHFVDVPTESRRLRRSRNYRRPGAPCTRVATEVTRCLVQPPHVCIVLA
jgi:hypothetical protein